MIKKEVQSVIDDVLVEIESAVALASSRKEAIELASYYGLFAISNYSRLYDGGGLEQKFIERFNASLPAPKGMPQREALHVVSISYQSGGHTRLMERLASMHNQPPDLVVTCQSNVSYNANGVDRLFNSIFDISGLEMGERLDELISLFSDYRNVILHIHTNDFIAAVAARVSKRNHITKVYFVNHADHLFSFGRSASDCILEVSAFGETLGRTRCPELNHSFLGIPIAADWQNINFESQAGGSKHIFTSGLFWKFMPKLGYSLPDILREIMKKSQDIELTALGVRPLRDHWWWLLKLAHPSRVHLRKSVPFEKYRVILDSSTFVLDSFPITGGTAFAEAIIHKKIALGINGPVTGYTPADVVRVSSAEEFSAILHNDTLYKEKLRNVLKPMESVHGMNAVKQRYLSALTGSRCVNLLLPDFQGDSFFFEKFANERGGLTLPASFRHRNISELMLELFIYSKFFWHFSFKSILKIIFTLLQLPYMYFKRT